MHRDTKPAAVRDLCWHFLRLLTGLDLWPRLAKGQETDLGVLNVSVPEHVFSLPQLIEKYLELERT